MTDRRTSVDVLSLEDFHRTLAARLGEAEDILKKIDTELRCRPPALGRFADASEVTSGYHALLDRYADRAARLQAAVTAAQSATETIIANYRTTEARNRASAADIAAVLGGVDAALREDGRADV